MNVVSKAWCTKAKGRAWAPLLGIALGLGVASRAYAAPPAPVLPVPALQQRDWQALEFIAFAHFGINTFTDREWGDGTEDPQLFNPTAFDANQWTRALKDAGAKLLILTAKHHDGFCLWPSAYTEHSVKNSPWKGGRGDVVREVADACQAADIQLGLYLSPWDRNQASDGDSPKYNQFFLNQLRELLTNYGEVTEVWFDGACGEGPNGKRQVYDFAAYYSLVRALQPKASIAIVGPDVRWVGNESGVARETEWSVRPVEAGQLDTPQISFNPTLVHGDATYLAVDQGDASGNVPLVWHPAECDVSIRPGWFYHSSQDGQVKTLDHLMDIYYKSIGRNSVLLLNIPPDRRGLFHENDVQRLRELREAVDATLRRDLAAGKTATATNVREDDSIYAAANVLDGDPETYWATGDGTASASLEIDLSGRMTFDLLRMQEPIELGQRIAEFTVEKKLRSGWKEIARGTTVGYNRLVRFPPVTASKIRINFTKSRGCPVIHTVGLYKQLPSVEIDPPGGPFDGSVSVRIDSDVPGNEILYTVDGGDPSESSLRYTGAFEVTESTTVKAIARGGFRTARADFVECSPNEPVMVANPSPGLDYTYYEGGWQSLQDLPHANAAGQGAVDDVDTTPRKRDDHFAFVYTGFIRASRDGIYTFYLKSDDGSRLSVAERDVVDHDGLHGMEEKEGFVGLQAGFHPFRLEYFNASGDRGLELWYEGPDIPKQRVPKKAYFRVNVGE